MRPERAVIVRLAEYLDGTCRTIVEACQALDLDEGVDWDDALLDLNVERCSHCDWWHESCMLTHVEEKNGFFCDQCLDELGVERD
jgi:hypothetical protein